MYKLIVMPPSHYCEKARWGLELAGVAYVEEGWPPVLHVWGTRGVSGSTSVPILRCPSGEHIADSSRILEYLHKKYPAARGLYPSDQQQAAEVRKLEVLFSEKLGKATRVVVYTYLFKNDKLCVDLLTRATSPTKARIFRAIFPAAKLLMGKGMNITDAHGAECLDQTRAIFADVSSRLSDGRQFLVGDQLTAADISFAALASPLLLPTGFGAQLPAADEFPAGFPCQELRDTPAGRYALRLFKQHRHSRAAPPVPP